MNYLATRLNQAFSAISDPTRRAILVRLETEVEVTVSQLAKPFAIKLPAVMKHLDVLESAGLILRQKAGRTVTVRLAPNSMKEAHAWLSRYERHWNSGLDRLATYAQEKEAKARKEDQ